MLYKLVIVLQVRTECNKVSATSLFHVPTAKHMRLEEFEQTQSQVTSQVSLLLKDSWITTLRNAIRTSLRDVGKGWFNLHETNWEVRPHASNIYPRKVFLYISKVTNLSPFA